MSNFLTSSNLLAGAIGILVLCWAFNMIFTSVVNFRRVKVDTQAPFIRIDASLNDIRQELDLLKRRVDIHDDEVKDLHTGQSAMCRGVQALLEHALHNGNEEEMKAAADGIGKWLRTR